MQASRANTFVRPVSSVSPIAWRAGLAVGFCLLTSLGAQVKVPVPWTDVPMTLQPLGVLLAGLLCSPATAISAMLLYIGAGAAGLPVFSPQSAGLFGPTGGYLVGFVPAAAAVGVLSGRRAGFVRLAIASAAGMACILTCGILWRAVFFGGDFAAAVATGLSPFAAKAMVEAGLAAIIADRLRRRGFRG